MSSTKRPRSDSIDESARSTRNKSPAFVKLSSHAGQAGVDPVPLKWGAADAIARGPVVATNRNDGIRNAIGAHGGSYSIYRALAVASKALDPNYIPNLHNTHPAENIGPHPAWFKEDKIVTLDPFGARIVEYYGDMMKESSENLDIRPTIAITRAHIDLPEIKEAIRLGRLKPDGKVLLETGQVNIVKAAVEPVWYLPGVASRFGVSEAELRELLFKETNGMYPELLTRLDIKVFLPPIGGMTAYIFGDVSAISDDDKKLCCRVHDECNGSDVFGSDICTCRPYLIHGVELAVKRAQQGGAGLIVYFRKEGRALGEVTKYLVYNARKRQEGGDRPEEYFNCTQNVAGVQDSRFQALMPDILHWLGVKRIDEFVSMSDMKYDAIVGSGIEIVERIPIPAELVPADAAVEIDAKVFAGYDGGTVFNVSEEDMKAAKGRVYEGKE